MSSSERLLAPVPALTHAQAGITATQKWRSEYNVACWVRARTAAPGTMTLQLRVRDAAGERQVPVDKAACSGTSGVLLSGRVAVTATGKIEEMTVWLAGEPGCDVIVDELYVQRIGGDQAARPASAVR